LFTYAIANAKFGTATKFFADATTFSTNWLNLLATFNSLCLAAKTVLFKWKILENHCVSE